NRTHLVHLSASAIEVLNSIPGVGINFVLTSAGSTPVSGFSRAKRRIDAAMLPRSGKKWARNATRFPAGSCTICAAQPLQGWRLNFPPHVVDKVLDHASGTIRGVATVYNRFEYLEERRPALEAWGRYVDNLVSPAAPSNVV